MRKYTLASAEARHNTDLRRYSHIIENAVLTVMPKATVKVEQDCYYVSPTPSQSNAIRIGRMICQSDLKVCCIQIPKLFSSVEIKEAKNDTTEQKHIGGHFRNR